MQILLADFAKKFPDALSKHFLCLPAGQNFCKIERMKPITTTLRVRYSETDQMGTFYNAQALVWFEVGRSEWLRATGTPYTQWEEKGIMLPLVCSHVEYLARARYDDELEVSTTAELTGKARMQFDIEIFNKTTGKLIAKGYTIHALTNPTGRPTRPPAWLLELLENLE